MRAIGSRMKSTITSSEASASFIALAKDSWAKRPPMPCSAISARLNSEGVCQKGRAMTKATGTVTSRFSQAMLSGSSRSAETFINSATMARPTADASAQAAPDWKVAAPGLTTIRIPAKPATRLRTRAAENRSPRKSTDPSATKRGMVKAIAVAEAKGISVTAMKAATSARSLMTALIAWTEKCIARPLDCAMPSGKPRRHSSR